MHIDVTYRLLIVSVSSYYILHIHIVTETRCVIIISIKLTFSLQYFYSLIKTTNSKNIHPYPCQNSISDYCLFRGFFFSPPVYLAITAMSGITRSPFTLPSRNNPLNNSHRFDLIITWHRLSVCKQKGSVNRHPVDRTKLKQCLYFKTFPLNCWFFSLASLKAYSRRENAYDLPRSLNSCTDCITIFARLRLKLKDLVLRLSSF